jgi:hypothetical protein
MRNPHGYAVLTGPNGEIKEADSFQCGHCQKITLVPPSCDPASLGGFCRKCGGLICPGCVTEDRCAPWEKQMEDIENAYRRQRTVAEYGT